MDYEQKYNEALERARNYHDNSFSFGTKELTEKIFPELRESEDERIRKKLYHTVLGTPNDSTWFYGTSKEAMLAWLEKQKESHIPWYDYQKSKEAGYTIVPNGEYEQLIKQKEQKPAEWSEEDEKMRYFVTEAVQSRYSDRELSKYIDPRIIKEKKQLKQKLFDWLRCIHPSWRPSEEQMEALEKAIVRSCSHQYGVPLSELYEQLKKI